MTGFWSTPRWHEYEAAYGDEPGTRAALLASGGWSTRVLDLAPEYGYLWRGVRKSYRSLIHAAERAYDIHAWIGRGSSAQIRDCQAVHLADAGRTTRPQATWDVMARWADAGEAMIVGAYEREAPGDCVGFAYFVVHGQWAYYFSAATLKKDVNAALVWTAIVALKACGVRTLEIGWQGEAADEKGQAIEFFRRGFGGSDVPVRDICCAP